LSSCFSPGDSLPNVDLKHNASLESLVIDFLRPTARLAFHVNAILSQVTSPSINEMEIGIELGYEEELGEIDWHILAQSLSEPKFSALRTLKFDVGEIDKDEARDLIVANLPGCGAREIVVICSLLCLLIPYGG
jgi:hypothetical protein